MEFGEVLKRIRQEKGMTQVALAEKSGLHRVALANLERGSRQPTWQTVQALAAALGVSCEAFQDDGKKGKRK